MWSQGRFPSKKDPSRPTNGHDGDDMQAFAAKTANLGFPHIEINYVIPPTGVETLLETNHVAVSSVHSPCPRITVKNGRKSDALNLAATDEEERTLAVERAHASIDIAKRAGASLLVVHLGGIDRAIFDEERQLRKLYDAGTRDGEEVEALRLSAVERRHDEGPKFFPQAKKSLAEIAEYGAAKNRTEIKREK